MMLAKNLKRIRLGRELTQVELSRRAGLSDATVAQYESNAREPGMKNLKQLAAALGVSINALVGVDDCSPLSGPLAERLAAAFAGLSSRDQEIVVVLAEQLAMLLAK